MAIRRPHHSASRVFLASPRTLSNTGRRRLGWLVAPVVIGVCLAGIGVGTGERAGHYISHSMGAAMVTGSGCRSGRPGSGPTGLECQTGSWPVLPGTTVTKVPSANIRVQLAGYASQFGLGTTGAGELIDTRPARRRRCPPGRLCGAAQRVRGGGDRSKPRVVDRASKGFRVLAVGSGFVQFDWSPVPRSLSVTASGGTINAINTVPLESYLRGSCRPRCPPAGRPRR